jgi:hypothetical protein
MAKIIEFYIPQGFRKVSRFLPPRERGKLLEFPLPVRRSTVTQGAGAQSRNLPA